MILKKICIITAIIMIFTTPVFAGSTVKENYNLSGVTFNDVATDDLGKGNLASVPRKIKKKGEQYTAVSVETYITKKRKNISKEVNFSNTAVSDLPKTITAGGEILELDITSIEETVNIRDVVTGTKVFSGCEQKPDIPETTILTSDDGLEVTGHLIKVEERKSEKLAEQILSIAFVGDADCRYYVINGKRIPNTFDEPTFKGYEDELLTYLNLPADDYDITGGSWKGGYIEENGKTVRHAVFTCTSDTLTDYTAYYTENLTASSPDYSTTDITAVYSNGIEDTEYDITVTVDYEREGLTVIQIIIRVSVAMLVLALLLAVILLIIRKRRTKDTE